jgi:hypothetical protein
MAKSNLDNLSDWEVLSAFSHLLDRAVGIKQTAGQLFPYLLDKAVSIDPALYQLINNDKLIKRVQKTLYTGKAQN